MELLFSECTDIGGRILHFIPLNIEIEEYERIQKLPIEERPIKTLLGTRLIHRMMLDLVATVVSEAMNNALLSSAPTRYCLSTSKTPVNIRLVGWNIDQGIAAGALESLSDLPREEFFMPFTLLCVTSHNFSLRYTFAKHIFEVLTEASEVASHYTSSTAAGVGSTCSPKTPLVSLWPRSCPIYRLLYRWLKRYSPEAMERRRKKEAERKTKGLRSIMSRDESIAGESSSSQHGGREDESESESEFGIHSETNSQSGGGCGGGGGGPLVTGSIPTGGGTSPAFIPLEVVDCEDHKVLGSNGESEGQLKHQFHRPSRSPSPMITSSRSNAETAHLPQVMNEPDINYSILGRIMDTTAAGKPPQAASGVVECPINSTGVSFSSNYVLELEDDPDGDWERGRSIPQQQCQVLGVGNNCGGGGLLKRPSATDILSSPSVEVTTGNSLHEIGSKDGSSFDCREGISPSFLQQPFGGPTIDIAAAGSPPRAEMAKTGAEVMDLHFHILSHWDIKTEDLCWPIEEYADHVGFVSVSSSRQQEQDQHEDGDPPKPGSATPRVFQSPFPGATSSASLTEEQQQEQKQRVNHPPAWRKKVYPAPFALDVGKGSAQFKDFKPLVDAAFGADYQPKGQQKGGGKKTAVSSTAPSGSASAAASTSATPTTTAFAPATPTKFTTDSFSMLPPTPLANNNGSFSGVTPMPAPSTSTQAKFVDPTNAYGFSDHSAWVDGNSFGSNLVGSSVHSEDGGMSERSTSTVTFFNEEEFTKQEERAGGAGSHRITSQLYCYNDSMEECVKLLPATCTALSLYGASGSPAAKPKFSLVKKKGDDIQIDLPSHIQWFSLSSIPTLRAITLRYATMQCIVLSSLPIFQDCYWCDGAMISLKSVHSFGLPTAAEGGGVAEAPLSSVAEEARDRMATELRGANEGWTTQRGPWATT